MASSADVFTNSCHVPSPRNGNTRLPRNHLETDGPTSSTIPTPSYPGMAGKEIRFE